MLDVKYFSLYENVLCFDYKVWAKTNVYWFDFHNGTRADWNCTLYKSIFFCSFKIYMWNRACRQALSSSIYTKSSYVLYGFSLINAEKIFIFLKGYFTINGIYVMEFLTPSWRQLAGCLGPLGEGVILLAILAYLIQPWRLLVWATGFPLITIFFIIP